MDPQQTAGTARASLITVIAGQAAATPGAPAILAPGRESLSYAGLRAQVGAVAGALSARGVGPSDRVAVLLPNGPEMATAFLGVASCCACAPLNPGYQDSELRFYLEDIDARAVLIAADESGPVRAVVRDLGLGVVTIEPDRARPAGVFEIDAGAPNDALGGYAGAGDVALLLHTSGTTARPKLVPLTHANLQASAHGIARHLSLGSADRCLNVMPLFHIHGLVGALLASLAAGGSVVCTPGFDDAAFFGWVAQFDPTWYTAVPTIHQAIVAGGAGYRAAAPAHRFRFVRSSSAALAPRTMAALQALTGSEVIEAYGMTEASHQMASNPLGGPRKPGSVGLPAGAEIALMDEAGHLLARSAIGEIVIRGPGVTAGYERNPDANAKAFRDGWFRTGDQGRFDDDGYLYILGRLKEIINRGGEKVSPREVDEALLDHADVAQAVAFAVPHPTLGEDLVAAVVLRAGAPADEVALRGFLLARLAGVKVPSAIVFVHAIPRGPTGKVQRAGLHRQLSPLLQRDYAAAGSEAERSLEAIVRDVLGCGPVGVHDNFFFLGGDSLKAAQVVTRLRAQFGIDIALPTLFAHPTIAGLAAQIETALHQARVADRALESEIEQMSDDEVARLLAAEEAAGAWNPR